IGVRSCLPDNPILNSDISPVRRTHATSSAGQKWIQVDLGLIVLALGRDDQLDATAHMPYCGWCAKVAALSSRRRPVSADWTVQDSNLTPIATPATCGGPTAAALEAMVAGL